MRKLTIGSRGSALALAQVEIVKGLLAQAHRDLVVEVRIIKTSGDRFQDVSLVKGGGKGLFTKEIEDQLLAGEIDLAVHSLKDLPTNLPEGLMVGATPRREDARDVLITKEPATLNSLGKGATVATSSIRRKAQLLAKRPDLNVVEIRGNVETRLRKLGENADWSGTMLAAAGLNRLGVRQGWPQYYWQELSTDVMIPAVGQGAIGIEIRSHDTGTAEVLAAINDPVTRACVEAEREFLHAIGGGCQFPYAAHAAMASGQLRLIAAAFSEDGKMARHATVTGSPGDAVSLGEEAARRINQIQLLH
jgi:hydroxymethylbilane synthase